jgi:endonuclease/exonuclease/phosphatase family metal-dependent hydrolase
LRVVTLNGWARGGDWPTRKEVLATGFRALAPDLVALQESVVTDAGDQAREIMGVGDGSEFVHSRRRSADGTGVSIASRWSIADVEELALDESTRGCGFPCTTLIATIEAPGLDAPVRFVNHFPSWKPQQELEREHQAVQAARRARRRRHVLGRVEIKRLMTACSPRDRLMIAGALHRSAHLRDAWADLA